MDIHKVIRSINPKAIYGVRIDRDGITEIDWLDETVPIPQSELDAKNVELDAEWTANEYARNRKAEYPDMGSQLNKIYDDGIEKWKTEMVDPIKAKYPK